MRGGIWEKFRSALCVSGGEGSDGEEDRLSALPDDVLLHVLCRLPSSAHAARTSVLSSRWRHLWTHLPVLRFTALDDPLAVRTSAPRHRWRRIRAHLPEVQTPRPADHLHRVRAALAAHAAPALRQLLIVCRDADPVDAAAVLLLAAPRLTGWLSFGFSALVGAGAIEMPCFDKAQLIYLHSRIGYLGLTLPPSGVFAKLVDLRFAHVRFHGPCNLGDTVSSARCPSLQCLCIFRAQGVSNLDIRSESLRMLDLIELQGLQQLTVVAPRLRCLGVSNSFIGRRPTVDISVPVLDTLQWLDAYDPSSVQLGELAWLRELRTFGDVKYESPGYPFNGEVVMLLQSFRKIPIVYLFIYYPPVSSQYMEEVITFLPDIEILNLGTSTLGRGIGPYVFHILSISSGIRKLRLRIHWNIKGMAACFLGCVCHQPQDSETEELILDSLQEVEIYQCRGSRHELSFLKRLLRYASVLKKVTLYFDPSVTVSEELCQELLGLRKQETCMKIYLYRNGAKVMYARDS